MRTQLNPYVVGLHLLLSMVLIALAVWLVREDLAHRIRGCIGPGSCRHPGHLPLDVAGGLARHLGDWQRPHAGDENALRNGLDGMLPTRLHSSMVYATVAASVVCFVLLRSRAVLLLLLVDGTGGDRCGATVGTADLAGCAPPPRRRWPLRRPPTCCSPCRGAR